jgi:hypothetical protein
MADQPTRTRCAMCEKPGVNYCGRCRGIRHCSAMCQEDDWSVHKLVCKQFTNLEDQPGPGYKRIILFSPTEDRPQFAWVSPPASTPQYPPSEIGIPPSATLAVVPIPYPTFMRADGDWAHETVDYLTKDPIFRCDEKPWINIAQYRPKSSPSSARPNKSIAAVNPELGAFWSGPMIAVAISDHNIVPTDFRRVVDFYRMDFVNKRITLQFANSDLPSQLSDDDLQGVRLNCEGDRRICRRPYIENWRLPAGVMYGNIPSFEPGARIGIPLFATPIPVRGPTLARSSVRPRTEGSE